MSGRRTDGDDLDALRALAAECGLPGAQVYATSDGWTFVVTDHGSLILRPDGVPWSRGGEDPRRQLDIIRARATAERAALVERLRALDRTLGTP